MPRSLDLKFLRFYCKRRSPQSSAAPFVSFVSFVKSPDHPADILCCVGRNAELKRSSCLLHA
jgi:hypothetical protein